MKTSQFITLHNGVKMPQLGFGVWRVSPEDGVDAVRTAIEVGYRHIDTAAVYKNEEQVGEAIRQSGIAREELFITTKVWNADQGFDTTLKAYEDSLKKLGLDYVDLYLVHWPVKDKYLETYKALEKLYDEKLVPAIGVSNFHIHHLEDIAAHRNIKPMVDQVELHPMLQQNELRDYCLKNGIAIEAWSPLMQGGEALTNPVISELAEKHGKTPAQVVLRWHLQRDVIAIPKSITPSRIQENFDVFNFELSSDDMNSIASLNASKRVGPDPDNFDF
ncbi:aldo/keto reductase [Gottfriedia solisilvae]|uniref:Glyoxal reductase n=1 Tax=Gottfriedia solisilvae TaxID=1516104 RepID=A0A8J3AIP3_9BACI|nr:aldo/keto reductase [Gottfriedia solisilvae]GGI15222.1 glyoxal reductase [Gottfriedia solisilvae]